MAVRLISVLAVAGLTISACATTNQENPHYQKSTQYKVSSPYSSGSTAQTIPASSVVYQSAPIESQVPDYQVPSSYQSATYDTTTTSFSQGYEDCRQKETNREILGGAIGGSVGAFAGKELVGGTKGTLIGAAVGGTAGYGLGDISVNCDPAPVPAQVYNPQPAAQTYYPAAHQTSVPQNVYSLPAQDIAPPPLAQPQTQTVLVAPTDQAYSVDTVGTPGYHAVMGSLQTPEPQSPVQYQPQPQQVAAAPQPVYVTQPLYEQPTYNQPPAHTYVAPVQTQPAVSPSIMTYPAISGGMHEVVEGDTVYNISRRLCVGVEDVQSANQIGPDFKIRLGETIRLPQSRC